MEKCWIKLAGPKRIISLFFKESFIHIKVPSSNPSFFGWLCRSDAGQKGIQHHRRGGWEVYNGLFKERLRQMRWTHSALESKVRTLSLSLSHLQEIYPFIKINNYCNSYKPFVKSNFEGVAIFHSLI